MIARAPTAAEAETLGEIMLAARMARPYYGRAIAALRPQIVDGLGTVAVGRQFVLYVDVQWLSALPLRQAAGVVAAHEIEHLLRDHTGRIGVREARQWNLAADAEINDDCHKEDLPPEVVRPEHLGCNDGMLAEDYYDCMNPSPLHGACGGGSGVGDPLPFEDNEGQEGLDIEQLKSDVAQDIREHIARNGRDSVPDSISVWANARAVASRHDWRSELRAIVGRNCREVVRGRQDYAWNRLSRRTRPLAPLRPGTVAPTPTVGLVVDTSGSVGGLGGEILGTVESIARASARLVCVACDATVKSKTKKLPRAWLGGGGTDLRVGLDALGKVDLAIVVTDGETPWPEKAPEFPVVIVLVGGGTVLPPFSARVVRASSEE